MAVEVAAISRPKVCGYRTISPSRPLAEYVRYYEYYETAAGDGSNFPFAVALLPVLTFCLRDPGQVFEYAPGTSRVLPRAFTVGPCDRRVADVIQTGRYAHFKVAFQPTGYFRLFHVSPKEIRNYAHNCADVLDGQISALHGRLAELTDPRQMAMVVESVLLERARKASIESRIDRAAGMLLQSSSQISLSAVSRSLGLSDSSWRRHFECEIGVTPKRYLRMLRFRQAVTLRRYQNWGPWTKVYSEAGYYDQSHFISEFREMGGSAPTKFMNELDAGPDERLKVFYST
jgi:AraC-like DNA-binding protein